MSVSDPTATKTAIEHELASVYRLYAALAGEAGEMEPESGLGGKLLFAGELDSAGCRLIRAANIAGAASLAASGDADAARQSMRDGVVDFVVNSLDEALRILKNEIRKREAVAVGVTVAPAAIVKEMAERGVQPDLLAPAVPSDDCAAEWKLFLKLGARLVEDRPLPAGKRLLTVAIPEAWARRTAGFDALLMKLPAADDYIARRWLRLSSRYLPTEARRLRSLACDEEMESRLVGLMNYQSD